MTQASMLHAKAERINIDDVTNTLKLLQTTSPSYILMASLDLARMQMATEGKKLLNRTIKLAEDARTEINKIPGITCFTKEQAKAAGMADMDETGAEFFLGSAQFFFGAGALLDFVAEPQVGGGQLDGFVVLLPADRSPDVHRTHL